MSVPTLDHEQVRKEYEALRREALQTPPLAPRGHGMALFLTRGMTAWLKVLAALSPRNPLATIPPQASSLDCAPAFSASLRGDITSILADMVLACSQKGMA